jgi:hypothetical protein
MGVTVSIVVRLGGSVLSNVSQVFFGMFVKSVFCFSDILFITQCTGKEANNVHLALLVQWHFV